MTKYEKFVIQYHFFIVLLYVIDLVSEKLFQVMGNMLFASDIIGKIYIYPKKFYINDVADDIIEVLKMLYIIYIDRTQLSIFVFFEVLKTIQV